MSLKILRKKIEPLMKVIARNVKTQSARAVRDHGIDYSPYLLVESKKNKCVLFTIFTSDCQAEYVLEGDSDQDYSFFVSRGKFINVISSLEEDDEIVLEINADTQRVAISSSSSKFFAHLPYVKMTHDSFIKKSVKKGSVKFMYNSLLSKLSRASCCVSTEETRYYLNAVYFRFRDEKWNLFATDGHRAVKLTLSEENDKFLSSYHDLDDTSSFLISRATLQIFMRSIEIANLIRSESIAKLASPEEDHKELETMGEFVMIRISPTQVSFHMNNMTILSNVVEGQFPDYDKTISAHLPNVVSFNKESLLKAIKRSSSILGKSSLFMNFSLERNRLNILATDSDFSKSRDSVDVEYDGEPFSFAFNYSYLKDIEKIFEDKKDKTQNSFDMRMTFSDSSSPFIFSALTDKQNEDEKKVLYALMPLEIMK